MVHKRGFQFSSVQLADGLDRASNTVVIYQDFHHTTPQHRQSHAGEKFHGGVLDQIGRSAGDLRKSPGTEMTTGYNQDLQDQSKQHPTVYEERLTASL